MTIEYAISFEIDVSDRQRAEIPATVEATLKALDSAV